MKRTLITGITVQDGSYLAELPLEKGYKVYGLKRGTSTENDVNIKHIINEIEFLSGDLSDLSSLIQAVKVFLPDEVYNLGAQSFVADSWSQRIYTGEVTGMGDLQAKRDFTDVGILWRLITKLDV